MSGKIKVLLVEDDIALRDMYETRLNYEGFDVKTAADGEEALSTAVSEQPDLILLDVMMPKISGFDVLNILKNTQATSAIPVIVLTVLDQESNRVKGLVEGAEDYMIKSQAMPQDVVTKIKEVLEKYGK